MSENQQDMYGTLTEEQKTAQIPYYVHEGEMNRMDRLNKRWFIAFLIVLVMLFVTNAGWIIYEFQYSTEEFTYRIEQDSGEGGNNTFTDNTVRFVGGDYNGEADNNLEYQAPGEER